MVWTLVLAACSSGPTAAPPPPPAPAEGVDPGARDAEPAAFAGTTGATDEPFTGEGTTQLEKVQAQVRDGFDRSSFTFSGALPGYHLEYVDQPIQCGSGEPVAIQGTAWLSVRFSPSDAHTDDGKSTVGFTKLEPALLRLKQVEELQQICDYEGVVTWVLGVKARQPYRVVEKKDPPRLVVDVEH